MQWGQKISEMENTAAKAMIIVQFKVAALHKKKKEEVTMRIDFLGRPIDPRREARLQEQVVGSADILKTYRGLLPWGELHIQARVSILLRPPLSWQIGFDYSN